MQILTTIFLTFPLPSVTYQKNLWQKRKTHQEKLRFIDFPYHVGSG